MHRLLAAMLLCLAACGGPVAESKRQGSAVDSPAVARRSVVLVLAYRADGKTGFGSGILLPTSGDILTNRHVVDGSVRLGIMFYDARRPSYAAEDGGLGRYVFENEADIVAAEVVRDSALLDMALLHVDASTATYPKLVYRTEPVEAGEQVFAIGHPGESVWSITQGLVSAVHNGLVQTDAAISFGNSGGPLLDSRGALVGMNTSRLLGDVDGVGFARPTDLLRAFIDDRATAELDLSTPASASLACTRAIEIASSRLAPCVAASDYYEVRAAAMAEVTKLLDLPEPARTLIQARGTVLDRATWIAQYVRAIQAYVAQTPVDPLSDAIRRVADAQWPLTPEVRRQFRAHVARADVRMRLGRLLTVDARQLQEEQMAAERARTGRNFADDGVSLRQSIRMGTRVEDVAVVDARHAWVLTVSRNPDGSTYRDSELWYRDGAAWSLRLPRPDETVSRPPDWPLPETFADRVASWRDLKVVWLLAQMAEPDA